MKVATFGLPILLILLVGCGKASTPMPIRPGGGGSAAARSSRPAATAELDTKLDALRHKLTTSDQTFSVFAERFGKDKRRFSGDMAVAARERVHLLKKTRAELGDIQEPTAQPLLDAYRAMLDHEIEAWDATGTKLAQALDNPANAREFDAFVLRVQERRQADLAKVEQARSGR